MNPYLFIIAICLVVITSFFFNALSKKTNIPSVLMLVILGVIINHFQSFTGYSIPNQMQVLELLGIVGLIMIVLEAALDLELTKEKWPIIWKSLSIALIGLMATSLTLSTIFRLFFQNIDFLTSLIYAVPLSIMSSAIVIPSVSNLSDYKKEFMIYESTFSDILGIMFFYLLLENVNNNSALAISWSVSSSIFITIIISLVVTYLLLFSFQNVTSEIKFFLFLASLIMLFSIGKLLHYSSLLTILIFGLVLRNRQFFIPHQLQRFIKMEAISGLFHNFQMITNETSFLVRTFFFVLFGMSISLSSLLSWKVWSISALLTIIATAIVMSLSLIRSRKKITVLEERNEEVASPQKETGKEAKKIPTTL